MVTRPLFGNMLVVPVFVAACIFASLVARRTVAQEFLPGDTNGSESPVLSIASPFQADQNAIQMPSSTGTGRERVRAADILPVLSADPSLIGVAPVADAQRNHGSVIFFNYESFMGVPDAGWANNGLNVGINFASRLGKVTDATGLWGQVGTSFGVFNWLGTDYRLRNTDRAGTQGFLTYGLYRRPSETSRILAGVVQDWSFNDTYGVFGENPKFSQLRGQLGYAVSASNEFGLMGATHVTKGVIDVPGFGVTTWQPISYLTTYWHHKWSVFGPDTWLSIGVPSQSRLAGGGSVGDYYVSANAISPLNSAVSLASGVTYMHPSASPGPDAATDETWDFYVGINIYPGRHARSSTVAGQDALPLLNVANNGTMIVDTDKSY